MDKTSPKTPNEWLARAYDERMYSPLVARYVKCDFHNFGYWNEDTKAQNEASANLMEILLGHIPKRAGTILDVACGKGATTQHLLRYWPAENVTAINVSEKQLATAREACPGATFRFMDAVNLDFPDESFDNIICVEAAFHFSTRMDFLREAHRVLVPGGRLVLSDVLITAEAEQERPGRHEANYVSDPEAYRQTLLQAGFSQADVLDSTLESWERLYWSAIRHYHEELIDGVVTFDELHHVLFPTYLRVPDIRYYIHAWAQKQ